MDNKQTIIIIGAGISGLTAANILADKYKVLILEGADRIGGRIHSLSLNGFSQVIEAGAEFIHGHQKETLRLLKEAGISYEAVEGEIYRKEKKERKKEEEFIDRWDQLLKKIKSIPQDMTMYDFLQEYFGEDKDADLRRQATAYAEGFDAADVKKVSVKSLYREWSREKDINFRIPDGYGALINYLADCCTKRGTDIITGDPVKQVDWDQSAATVYTASGKKYFASKVIVTVSVNVLQTVNSKASINFTPPLDEQVRAARQIGFGSVIKIILQFKERFWGENTGFIFSDEEVPTWWTQLPRTNYTLTGWIGGGRADRMKALSNDEILEKGLHSLANIFDLSLEQLKFNLQTCQVFNWRESEFVLGAYSYDTPQSESARKLLNSPIEDTIYFCGEALYDGPAPGTVEAAIVHAMETAKQVM
jgi:monoamine oxidase